jgi:hypothetical protein
VGQFVDALKTSIMNALAIRGLYGTNCEDDDGIFSVIGLVNPRAIVWLE